MALTSVGYSGSIGWAQWAALASSLGIDYGVVGADDLKATIRAAGAGEVTVAAGTAFGAGITDTEEAATILTGLTTPNTWWTIVVRRDWSGGPGEEVSSLMALAGGASKGIASARQVGPGTVDDQPIALVHRGASALDQLIDLRCWWGNGGAFAASTEALGYLGRPGSVVWVGSTLYRTADGVQWIDKVPLDSVPALPASQVTSGTLALARVPSLPASQVSSGVFAPGLIPTLDASKIGAGTLNAARIPTLDASKIAAGTLTRSVSVPSGSVTAGGVTATTLLEAARLAVGGTSVLNGDVSCNKGLGVGQGLVVKGIADLETRIRSIGTYGNTYSFAANVYVTSAGNLGRATSSARYKEKIQDARPMPSVLDIRPRTWVDKAQRKRTEAEIADGTIAPGRSVETLPRHFGAIAEELHDLGLTELVVYDEQGRPDAISEARVVYALIPEVRANRARIVALEEQVAQLAAAVAALTPAPPPAAARPASRKGRA